MKPTVQRDCRHHCLIEREREREKERKRERERERERERGVQSHTYVSPSRLGRKYWTFCCSSKISIAGQPGAFTAEEPLKMSTVDKPLL